MAFPDEAAHLGARGDDRREDREDRLAAFLHLLVQHLVSVVQLDQPGAAEDHHHEVDLVEAALAIVDRRGQVLGRAGADDVDGVADGRAGVELRLQLVGHGALELRDVEPALREGVGQHDGGPAGVGDDGAAATRHGFQRKNTSDRRQLLAAEAADDPRLAEERLDGGIGAGDGPRVRRGRPLPRLGAPGLDGGDAAALADERRGVVEQLVRVSNLFDIKHLDRRVQHGVEVLIHILEYLLDAYLLGVAHGPYRRETQSLRQGRLNDEQRRPAGAGDEIDSLGVELGNGLGKDAVVACVHHADAVRADERGAVVRAGVQHLPLEGAAFGCFLAKTGRDDDEGADALVARQDLDGLGARLAGDGDDGELRRRDVAYRGVRADALDVGLVPVDDAQLAGVFPVQKVAREPSARLVDVVRAADHDDAPWVDELFRNHDIIYLN